MKILGKMLRIKKALTRKLLVSAWILSWSHLGSNQGPPDYESGALTD